MNQPPRAAPRCAHLHRHPARRNPAGVGGREVPDSTSMSAARRQVTIKSVRFEKKSRTREIRTPEPGSPPPMGQPLPDPLNQITESPEPRSSRRRVAAVVGLTLLEVIRRQDLPKEILEAEDPSITMPRRLGLSEVIDRQIRIYREEVRKRGRMTDGELRDLIRLVVRRPDSAEVLFRAGGILAGEDGWRVGTWRRLVPDGLGFALARRAVARRLRKLFGRRLVVFTPGPFAMESRARVLIDSDPGGDACHLVTGLAESIVQRYASPTYRVSHDKCKARRDSCCRWTVLQEEAAHEPDAVPDLLLNPEPGAG